jgi:hypothetical protein
MVSVEGFPMIRRKMFWGSILALGFFAAGLLFA